MLAYHSDPALKERILAQLAQHRAADEIVKGQYWRNGKGCAVGCTIHSGNHAEYEPRFGIPQALAFLEDRIFEGLPNAEAKLWPERFISAIRPGADLSRVHLQFLHWLLTVELQPHVADSMARAAVARCAVALEFLTRGEPVDSTAVEAAAWAAQAAADAAWEAPWAAEAAAAQAAADAARAASYQRQADQLISLLEAA